MKERPQGFLAESAVRERPREAINYIAELEAYLWRVINVMVPGAIGRIEDSVDVAVANVESRCAVCLARAPAGRPEDGRAVLDQLNDEERAVASALFDRFEHLLMRCAARRLADEFARRVEAGRG